MMMMDDSTDVFANLFSIFDWIELAAVLITLISFVYTLTSYFYARTKEYYSLLGPNLNSQISTLILTSNCKLVTLIIKPATTVSVFIRSLSAAYLSILSSFLFLTYMSNNTFCWVLSMIFTF